MTGHTCATWQVETVETRETRDAVGLEQHVNLAAEETSTMTIVNRMLREGLADVFGRDWQALSNADQALIVRDCTEEGGVDDLVEYRRRIGVGNLPRYAETMRARFQVTR